MEYIKQNFKKLGSMSLILIGVFLILEHIYTYGRINLFDFLGHEWIGIIFIVFGLIWANQWSQKWSDAWKETKEKLQYIFKKKEVRT